MSERHNPAAYPKLVTITPPSLQGLPFALAYPKLVNDSVHSLHMASHIFLRTGEFAKVRPGVVSEVRLGAVSEARPVTVSEVRPEAASVSLVHSQ